MIEFSYPAHLRDQLLQVDLSPTLDDWTAVAGNLRSIDLESFTPTVALSSSEMTDEVQVVIEHNPSTAGPYTPPNLIRYGSFEGNSAIGWTRFGATSPSMAVALDGSYSLELIGPGGFGIPAAYQRMPASAGEEFILSEVGVRH